LQRIAENYSPSIIYATNPPRMHKPSHAKVVNRNKPTTDPVKRTKPANHPVKPTNYTSKNARQPSNSKDTVSGM
jgi:hypothetical protein